MRDLPIIGQPRPERADAARNRLRILSAAERLFADRGVEHVSMDDIAVAARVGKGTLYRRFGDKAGLGIAVLDARERDLQDAILHGPPPLGPGAPDSARLKAFVDSYLQYLERNLDLLIMSETAAPGARYRTGVYVGWRRHVESLLIGCNVSHPRLVADFLMAPLAGEVQRYLRDAGAEAGDIRAALSELVERVANARPVDG